MPPASPRCISLSCSTQQHPARMYVCPHSPRSKYNTGQHAREPASPPLSVYLPQDPSPSPDTRLALDLQCVMPHAMWASDWPATATHTTTPSPHPLRRCPGQCGVTLHGRGRLLAARPTREKGPRSRILSCRSTMLVENRPLLAGSSLLSASALAIY